MRPVDLLIGAPHAFYDQTFDTLSPAPLLVLADYTWAGAVTNPVYIFFRNNQLWGTLQTPGIAPVAVASPIGDQLAATPPANVNPVPPRDLGIPNRDNTGNLTIHAQMLRIQTRTAAQVRMRIRLGIPPFEAIDLGRVAKERVWNLPNIPAPVPAAVIPDYVSEAVWNKAVPDSPDAVPNMPAAAGTYYGYRGSIRDLQATLGGYCSYCEAKQENGTTYDVEHRLPKESYPADILLWRNFLMGCTVCNQRFKRREPYRSFGIEKAVANYHPGMPAFAGGDAAPLVPGAPAAQPLLQYAEMVRACDEYCAWPSLDDGGAGGPIPANPANPTNYSLLCFSYRLREYDAAGAPVGWVAAADATNLRNVVGEDGPANTNTVKAKVWDSALATPALREMFVRVEVVARSPNTANAAFNNRKQLAAAETIRILGLNSIANAFGDRRMMQRTYAWFDALNALRNLREQLARLNTWRNSWLVNRIFGRELSTTFVQDQWEAVALAAEQGYYSVWLTVFKAFTAANPAHANDTMAATLAQTLNDRATANILYRYKGTNLMNSVLNLLPNL